MSPYNPSLGDFLERARREFHFLVAEFGFEDELVSGRDDANDYQVRYHNRSTLVIVEGINWGYGVDVRLEPTRQPVFRPALRLPLWAIVKLRKPDLYDALAIGDQRTQLASHAVALRECAPDVLGGDFSIRAGVATVLEEAASRMRSSDEERRFRTAIAEADAAFRSKDYRAVAEILLRHEKRLGPAQRAKLEYAKRKMHV
jgi:hypothetical protein